MKKFRWFSLTPISANALIELNKGFLASRYTAKRKSGFLLAEATDGFLAGSFIQRREFMQEIEDPLVGAISIPRIEVSSLTFRISHKAPNLEVYGAIRLLPDLINEIGKQLEYSVAIEQITPEINQWLKRVDSRFEKLTVHKLWCSDLFLSSGCEVDFVASSAADVRREIGKFIGQRKAHLDKVRCSAEHNGVRIEFAFNDVGELSVSEELREDVLETIRSCVRIQNA